MEDSSEDGFFSSARREADRQITGFTLDQLTGHSPSSGTAAYIRSEIARSLAADRAAATAVMAPIEILYQFNSDRSQSQQITVRLDSATGEYSPVDDTTILHNYGGVDSDDDDDEDVDDSSTVNDSDDGDQAGSVSSDSCTDSQRVMSVDSDGPFSDAESDPEHDGSSASQQGQIAHKIDQLQSEIVGLRLYTGAWEAAERLKPGQRLHCRRSRGTDGIAFIAVFDSAITDRGSRLGDIRHDTAAAVQARDAQQARRRPLYATARGPLQAGRNTVAVTLTYQHGDVVRAPDARTVAIDNTGVDTEQQERAHKTLQEYRHSQASDADDDPDDSGDDPPSDNEKANGRPRRVKLMPQTARSGRGTLLQQTTRRAAAAESPSAADSNDRHAVSKRKSDSPQLTQQAMKMGLSPSQEVTVAMVDSGRRRISVVGATHQSAALDGLQSPTRSDYQQSRPQQNSSLTWRRGPFGQATPSSVHMDPAARRLKAALSTAFDAAAAAGATTSVSQRKKYMGEINVRNVLVALGPSNALILLGALEDSRLEDNRLAASRATAIISAAKIATSDPYVSGALGKLAACIPSTATARPSTGTTSTEQQAPARRRTDMTKFPAMFGGEARPVPQAAST